MKTSLLRKGALFTSLLLLPLCFNSVEAKKTKVHLIDAQLFNVNGFASEKVTTTVTVDGTESQITTLQMEPSTVIDGGITYWPTAETSIDQIITKIQPDSNVILQIPFWTNDDPATVGVVSLSARVFILREDGEAFDDGAFVKNIFLGTATITPVIPSSEDNNPRKYVARLKFKASRLRKALKVQADKKLSFTLLIVRDVSVALNYDASVYIPNVKIFTTK